MFSLRYNKSCLASSRENVFSGTTFVLGYSVDLGHSGTKTRQKKL